MLLDVVLRREPHVDTSRAFLLRVEQGAEPACTAWHTVSNVHYVAGSEGIDARGFILDLLERVEIAPTNGDSVRYAASLRMADFEDALQVAAAEACGARQIVTRNLKDYERSPIRAVSPLEAIDAIS